MSEEKISPETVAFIQRFLNELQGLQRVIEKGEPFHSLKLDQLAAEMNQYPDMPQEFRKLVAVSQKTVQQIKDMYAKGMKTEDLIIISQVFGPFFDLLANGAKRIGAIAGA